jgi:ribose transport system permease protein
MPPATDQAGSETARPAVTARPAAGGRPFGTDSLGLLAALGLLVALFAMRSEHFLTTLTITTLLNQIPALTVVAIGMTYVLVVGGIDLSVGSVLALSGSTLGVALVSWNWPLWAAAAAGVALGLLAGTVNGLITAGWSVPSFIVTLGTLEIARGAAYLMTRSQSVYVGAAVEPVGAPIAALGLSPAFIISLVLVAAGQVVLARTVLGRYMIAVGTNEQAVRLSGIDPRVVKVTVFVIAGAMAGLGGVFSVAHLESADPNAGVGMELAAIAAGVIGGTSLMGGRGSVVNSFLGVLIIAVLQAGLAQVGASEPAKRVITGVVIVLAVVLDVYRHRVGGRRSKRRGRR